MVLRKYDLLRAGTLLKSAAFRTHRYLLGPALSLHDLDTTSGPPIRKVKLLIRGCLSGGLDEARMTVGVSDVCYVYGGNILPPKTSR